MAKKKKEEPIVDNETGSIKVKPKKEKQLTGNETKGNVTKVKEKMKMKPVVEEETITKVDLNKPPIEEDKEEKIEEVVVAEEKQETTEEVLEEIKDKEEKIEDIATEAQHAIQESVETGEPLPEGIQKLVDFMDETGGDLNDYVKLNQDYSDMDNHSLLQEYYKQTKPHLTTEEVDFLMEDQFSFDEETDESRDIKRKKLALKEQVANAKTHLEETKSKYYKEIKSGSKLTTEQQEAINFYQKSIEYEQYEEKAKTNFLNRTNKFFGDQFKGFEYNVGDKNYRFKVNDADKVRDTQSDINNFIGKFLDKDRQMSDEAGYHKSLFTAMNPDAVAKHFYEQGKADALKDSIAKSKNVDMTPRQELNESTNSDGLKFKVLGDNTADFKFKIKNKK